VKRLKYLPMWLVIFTLLFITVYQDGRVNALDRQISSMESRINELDKSLEEKADGKETAAISEQIAGYTEELGGMRKDYQEWKLWFNDLFDPAQRWYVGRDKP
jgi:hypothetical protein